MPNESVVLLHGLAESSLWMMPAASALRMADFEPVLFDYPSTRHPIEKLADTYLKEFIDTLENRETLHFVGHSMGAVMLRYYLQNYRISNLGRIVMMAPGNHGSPVLSLYKHHLLYETIMGHAGAQSAADEDSFADQLPEFMPAETGIIAGCLSFDPLATLTMSWPHDGKTTVEGTKLENMTDHITLPTGHDLMMFDPVAIYQAVHFLKHGRFSRPWGYASGQDGAWGNALNRNN
jgi:pimeloyl-ACP methyl ester carboxylesterase